MKDRKFKKYIRNVLSHIPCNAKMRKKIKEDLLNSLALKSEQQGRDDPEVLMGKPAEVAKEFCENLNLEGKMGFEYISPLKVFGYPLVHVNTKYGGTVKGVIAIGRVAVGIVAIGAVSLGVMSVGAICVGLLAAIGSFAFSGIFSAGGGGAASYIIKKVLTKKLIDKDTTLIESSSGNFGIALSAYCKKNGLKFIAVVDPFILPINEFLIKSFGAEVIKVNVTDSNGGYLLNRIKKVNELINEIDNSYWVNQYANPYNAETYYHTLGNEICRSLENIDYLFIGVSSGGTITGVSNKIKEKFPNVKVIAVDIVGSVIFGHPPRKRYIPGIGSSIVPKILKKAKIDDIVMIDEVSTIDMCHELLKKHYIFAGGSSGSVFAAIKKYFTRKKVNNKVNVVTVFADRGERYANTIYNEEWCRDYKKNHLNMNKLEEIKN